MTTDSKSFLDIISTILEKSNFYKVGPAIVKFVGAQLFFEQARVSKETKNISDQIDNHQKALVCINNVVDFLAARGATHEECLQIAKESGGFLIQGVVEKLKVVRTAVNADPEMRLPPTPPNPPTSHPPLH